MHRHDEHGLVMPMSFQRAAEERMRRRRLWRKKDAGKSRLMSPSAGQPCANPSPTDAAGRNGCSMPEPAAQERQHRRSYVQPTGGKGQESLRDSSAGGREQGERLSPTPAGRDGQHQSMRSIAPNSSNKNACFYYILSGSRTRQHTNQIITLAKRLKNITFAVNTACS